MLELTYVSLLCTAFAAAYLAVVREQAPLVTAPAAMSLFATVAYASYGVRPSFGSGTPADYPGLFVLGMGGVLVMLIVLLRHAIATLPEVGSNDLGGQSGRLDRLKRTLRGNNRL
jgi:hypothetical protein